jgi:hypothetical protein
MKKCNLIIKKLYHLKAPIKIHHLLVEMYAGGAVRKLSDIHDDHTHQTSIKRMHVNAASVVEFVWLLK